MNRGFVCFLVLGLVGASLGADLDSVGSETKTISAKISNKDPTPSSVDKSKRGVVKLSNAENPGFNHLGTNNAGAGTTFKATPAVGSNPPPFRYLYNNQLYQQPNPYLTYVQMPQATQIAAQYAFQSNPVHYIQTPTQIQYVSTPTVAQIPQVPQVKYQSYSNEYSSAGSNAGSSASASSNYASAPQQALASPSHSYSSSATALSAAQTSALTKQVQVPFYSGYQASQPVYYPQQQQPYFTFLPQTHVSPANFIYQQPNANYYLKQQPYLNLYGGNRFGLYAPSTQSGQLTYLVPMAVPAAVHDQATTTDAKASDKTNTAQSNSFSYGTKA